MLKIKPKRKLSFIREIVGYMMMTTIITEHFRIDDTKIFFITQPIRRI